MSLFFSFVIIAGVLASFAGPTTTEFLAVFVGVVSSREEEEE